PGQYTWGDGSGTHDTSRALVVAPVVDLNSVTNFCPTNKMPSGSTVPVVGCAQVFIQGADSGKDNITVYIVNLWGCDSSTSSDTSNTGSPLPLRLVRTQ